MNGQGNIESLTMYEITDVLQRLLEINEFQAICWAMYSVCLILLVGLLGIFCAHTAYVIIGSRIMYRRKKPQEDWSKQFYPAVFLVSLVTAFITWVFWRLANGVIPFTN